MPPKLLSSVPHVTMVVINHLDASTIEVKCIDERDIQANKLLDDMPPNAQDEIINVEDVDSVSGRFVSKLIKDVPAVGFDNISSVYVKKIFYFYVSVCV